MARVIKQSKSSSNIRFVGTLAGRIAQPEPSVPVLCHMYLVHVIIDIKQMVKEHSITGYCITSLATIMVDHAPHVCYCKPVRLLI